MKRKDKLEIILVNIPLFTAGCVLKLILLAGVKSSVSYESDDSKIQHSVRRMWILYVSQSLRLAN